MRILHGTPCGGRSIILTIKRFVGGMPFTSSWSRSATYPNDTRLLPRIHSSNTIFGRSLWLGQSTWYRALFTIREQTVYVLAIHRAAQDTIHADDLPSVPGDQ